MPVPPPRALLLATQRALRAMDHPVRQRILALLFERRRALAYNEIAAQLGISDSSAIAHHLRALTGAALVGNHLLRVDGKIRSVYSISDSGVSWMKRVGLSEPEGLKILIGA